jgi:hypothetical protein
MRSLTLPFLCLLFTSGSKAAPLDDYVKQHGEPTVVAVAQGTKKKEASQTVIFFGIDRPPSAALAAKRNHLLIYSSDRRFDVFAKYHFENLQQSESTMYAPISGSIDFDLALFNSDGGLLEERHLRANTVYLYATMTERIATETDKTK